MDPLILANLIIRVGTEGIPLVLKLKQDIDAGRTQTTVTDADLQELQRLANQSAQDILARAGGKAAQLSV